jgi:histidinol-phosphate aminotransferase
VSAPAAVTYLCRPNNPTGTLFQREDVASVLARAAGVVLIDEAYADYAEDDVLDLVLASERALSLRTLSKACGLAGLRIGYALGPADLIAEVEKSRGPYKVSGPAEAAALAVLARDMNWVREGVAAVRENRVRLSAGLEQRGIRCWPSAGNFVLAAVPPGYGGAVRFAAALRARGVAVRAFAGLPHAGECIRVSVGPWHMMAAFLDALDGVLATGKPRGENE